MLCLVVFFGTLILVGYLMSNPETQNEKLERMNEKKKKKWKKKDTKKEIRKKKEKTTKKAEKKERKEKLDWEWANKRRKKNGIMVKEK